MPNPQWPSGLPQRPLAQGYKEGFGSGRMVTPMEVGPAKRRLRTTASPRDLDVVYKVDAAQLETFRTFYETTIARGTLTFDLPHPRTGTMTPVAFRDDDRDNPAIVDLQAQGLYWHVRLGLEILP